MDKNSIVLNRPGVYLFHSPTKVSVQLNRELLLLLSVPKLRLVGFLLTDAAQHPTDTLNLLDTLLKKMNRDFHVSTPDIQAKMLGMGSVTLAVNSRIKQWLSDRAIPLVADDTGRNVVRTVFVDCESGLAGVSYAENFSPKWNTDDSVSTQSLHPISLGLVLTNQRGSKSLCEKMATQLSDWSFEIPNDVGSVLKSDKNWKSYSAFIIFGDIAKKNSKTLKKFLTELKQSAPRARIFWVGKRPDYASQAFSLPKSSRDNNRALKKALLSELSAISGHAPGNVIPFPLSFKVGA